MAHPGLVVVHAFYMPGGDDLHQVAVAVVVLGQKDEVIVLAMLVVLEVVIVVLRHIDLAAYDRLYGGELRRHVFEVLDTVHVAMIRYGKAGHAKLLGTGEQFLYITHPVEDGVLCMDVQVYERHAANIRKTSDL